MAGRRSVARWRDWREWQDVHAGLFSADLYEQQRAVSRVAAWRCRGEVPISVNATAQLVEIAVHEAMAADQHHAIGVSARSQMELSLLYACAIVRCVNGLVDCSQKGTYAMAVSALAQRIGIPLWIVDLRHESTHNQLPSLPVLRFAASHLLAWLRSNYWFKQEDVIRTQVRQVGELLAARMPLPAPEGAATAELQQLKDSLDVDKLREVVIPLLVNGHQYGEQVFPNGALFQVEFLPEAAPESSSETELLAKYPKEELIRLVLELQTLWRSMSACLIAALCQKVAQFVVAAEETLSAQVELALFWIKLLISNEWRERLKYAEEPIEDIYRSGASMLALCERLPRLSAQHNVVLLDRLRATLRNCKGVRNHVIVGQDIAVRKQLNGATGSEWIELKDWMPSPLGQINAYTGMEIETPVEYPLDIDQRVEAVFTSARIDSEGETDEHEDDAMDRLMAALDSQYDEDLSETLTLAHAVHEHVIQGAHQNSNQKVLPQQEVERIQMEIEIW